MEGKNVGRKCTEKGVSGWSEIKIFPLGALLGRVQPSPDPSFGLACARGNLPRPQGGTKAAHPLHPSLLLKQLPSCIV